MASSDPSQRQSLEVLSTATVSSRGRDTRLKSSGGRRPAKTPNPSTRVRRQQTKNIIFSNVQIPKRATHRGDWKLKEQPEDTDHKSHKNR